MVAVNDAVYDEIGEDLEYDWLCIPWEVLLPRLREMLDLRGLRHIAIVNYDDDPHLTPEQLNERFVKCDDYYVSFKPIDPDWRIYKVEGAPFDRYVREAKAGDFHGTPTVSLSKDGKWEMAFGYAQGMLPAEVFDNEQAFLAGLVDCLVRHFSERTYTLRVSVIEERIVLDHPD
jgi:hypothetical protein